MKFEEVRDLLTEKFSDEKKRLKSFGTKASSFDLANAVTRYVQAYACRARYEELKQLGKVLHKQPSQGDTRKIWNHYRERKKATKDMSRAIFNVAERDSRNRPWKRKTHKHKHKHKKRGK